MPRGNTCLLTISATSMLPSTCGLCRLPGRCRFRGRICHITLLPRCLRLADIVANYPPKTRYCWLVRPSQTGFPPVRMYALIWTHPAYSSPQSLQSSSVINHSAAYPYVHMDIRFLDSFSPDFAEFLDRETLPLTSPVQPFQRYPESMTVQSEFSYFLYY